MSDVSIEALHVERPDPLWPNDGTAPFDYAKVDGGYTDEPAAMNREEAEMAALVVARLMRWFAREGECRDLRTIGQRVVSLAWVLNPDGKSQGEVAEHFGANPKLISRHAAEASRKFGIKNRFQSHAPSGRQNAENPPISEGNRADVK